MSEDRPTEEVIAVSWHSTLSEYHKGKMAELRRCKSLEEAKMTPGYSMLLATLQKHGYHKRKNNVALAAAALSHVKPRDAAKGDALGQAMARGSDSGDPLVKLGRFQRFIQRQDSEEVFRPLLRILGIVDDAVSLFSLASDLLEYDKSVRYKWAEDYHRRVLPAIDV